MEEAGGEVSAGSSGGSTASVVRYEPEVVGATDGHPGYERRIRCKSGPNERIRAVGRVTPLDEALKRFCERRGGSILEPVI